MLHSAPLFALALIHSVPSRATLVMAAGSTAAAPACDLLLRGLFTGVIDPDAVAGACSADIVWDDLTAPAPVEGRAAVRALVQNKFPQDARLVIERLSDGRRSGGFTWHREAVAADDGSASPMGLRGTLYAELNDAGQLRYVREASEPILKPGQATEVLLKAATANMEKPVKTPTFKQATPKSASGVARYLWEVAYPGGASPSEALRLFSKDIVYEDFNYEAPFVGIPTVTEFVNAFDIPGIDFVPLKISEGDRACAFTWKVLINGQDGPQGLSFYEVDTDGKVCFIRDIPAPSPRGFRPLGALAASVDPVLHVFTPATLTRAALGIASAAMGLLKPAFAAEAKWQAQTLGGKEAQAAALKQLDESVASAPVVVYTYTLSPFSTEALALLDATGCEYKTVELGLEWFLLDSVGSSIRALLLERYGMSSLPHIFIGGESVGGLYSGNAAGAPGLVELKRRGELTGMLQAAGAL